MLGYLVVGKNADGSWITAPIAGTLQGDGSATLAVGTPAAPPIEILTANLAFWLKKGTASSSAWPDASGNGHNMVLTGGVSATANMVSFNGTSQYGVISAPSGLTATFSVYAKLRQNTWGASSRIFGGASYLAQLSSSPNIGLYDTDTTPYALNSGAAIGQLVPLAVIQKNADVILNINGVETSAMTAYDPISHFALAGNYSGGALSCIDVVEIIAYNVAHDSTQKAHMLSYLATL